MFKNFKFIGIVCLVLAAMVAFSSCSKPEKQIIGKWKITKAKYIEEGYDLGGDDKGEIWTFRDNGKCVLFMGGFEYDGSYSVKKNTLTINVQYRDERFYFTLSGDVDIDELTKDEMAVSGNPFFMDYENLYSCWPKISYELEKN
jgi:hypothetical protein